MYSNQRDRHESGRFAYKWHDDSGRARILLNSGASARNVTGPLVADGPVFKPNPQRGRGFRCRDKVELFHF